MYCIMCEVVRGKYTCFLTQFAPTWQALHKGLRALSLWNRLGSLSGDITMKLEASMLFCLQNM